MIVIFTAMILILSLVFAVTIQYHSGSITLITAYTAALILTCVGYLIYERLQRRKLIARISALFNGEYRGSVTEDDLSGLERQVMLRVRSNEAREVKLTEGYKSLSSLVSDIAHQCKTPLTSVFMYADMLPDNECAAQIKQQAEKLRFMIEALTKLSKCEGGLITENLNPVENNISELVCRAVSDIYTSSEEKSIEITSYISGGLTAYFDMRWTAEAVFNILDNAVKYSPEHSKVRITACGYNMFVRIDISDNGSGIADNEICNIWKRFYRGKNVADTQSGVGIGLYLCHMILIAQGGHAAVQSEIGRGSVFSVFLPKRIQ